LTNGSIHAIIEKSDGGDRMDKMLETTKLLAMLCVILCFGYVCGWVNFYSPFYQPAEASAPSSVTINGRSASLLSGYANLTNAFGLDYDMPHGCVGNSSVKLIDSTNWGFAPEPVSHSYRKYVLDMSGENPDVCSIYNGITTASTNEELEAAFGDDCLKTDEYYAEIFLDDVEVDYEKINFPADFDYDRDFSWGDWWKDIKTEYPETRFCTVLFYNKDNGNGASIVFLVFENEQLTQKE